MAATTGLKERAKDELYELARELDIHGRSDMDKGQLVEAIEEESGSGEGDGKTGSGGKTDELDRATTKRSVWKGAISFGLITVPVGLYTAVEDRGISFHLLSDEDGSRIKYKRVSAKTDEEVDWDDIVKGYEYEEGSYVTFTHEELERIPADSAKAIDVVQFADAEEIDPIYFDRTYYVAPEETGVKAYRVLLEALESSGRVGIGKVTIREKERLCTLRARDDLLVIETMNWPDEIRVPDFETLDKQVSVSDREVEMASSLVDQLTEEFDPTKFHDSYRDQLEKAITAKIEGEEIQLAPDTEPELAGVTNLLEALQASVEATKQKRSA